jgi:hypothetical protein
MKQRRLFAALLLAALVALALAGPALAVKLGDAEQGGRQLATTLTGEQEAPGPGDPDGSGDATVTVNPGQGVLCYELSVSGIAPAISAHIHKAPPGEAGDVVVGLEPPTDGSSSGCVEVGRALAKDILKTPSDYYVNVHNAEYPAGALRGQLGK